jgi:hypothetical protein
VLHNDVYYGTRAAVPAATQQPVFTDDFSTLNTSRWVITPTTGGNAYTVSGGRLAPSLIYAFVPGANSPALLADALDNVHSIEITNYRTGTTGNSFLWVAFQDDNNWIGIQHSSGTNMVLLRRSAGTTTDTIGVPCTSWTGGSTKLKAAVDSSRVVTIYQNDTLIYTSPQFASFSGTKTGIGDDRTGYSTWDDAVVSSPAGTTPFALSSPWVRLGNKLPTGGTTGQVLSKASATDYDATWVAATSGVATVQHGATASTARPTATVVFWYGSVEPTNMTATDIWVVV